MPELPEVETTKRSLKPLLGCSINEIKIFQPKLRWPIPDNLLILKNYQLHNVRRRAKYLILEFKKSSINSADGQTNSLITATQPSNTKTLLIHLGMSGSLQQYPANTPKRKHDHVIFSFNKTAYTDNDIHDKFNVDKTGSAASTGDVMQLHYHDPRRFGAVLWFNDYADKLLNHLGVEPLEDSFTADYLYQKIHKIPPPNLLPFIQPVTQTVEPEKLATAKNSFKPVKSQNSYKPLTRSIKAVIMDQVIVVGVGNIYATEALFLSGIHPSTPANRLSRAQLSTLTAHIKTILKRAIKQGGSTLKDFTVGDGTTGYFQQTLNVYGKYKLPCARCDTPIDKVIITGRASTFCPVCQPLMNEPN